MPAEICRIRASMPRRFIMLACLGLLALIMIWLGFTTAESGLAWQVGFLAAGAVILAFLPRMFRATGIVIILTDDALHEDGGRELARIDQIARVERGAFAFKPSNGFVLTLKSPAPRGWEPGIWWRIGRKIGVGGVIPASQTKLVADIIAAKISGSTLI